MPRFCKQLQFSLLVFIAAIVLPTLLRAADPVDWLWTAKYVVTMDSQRRVIENGAVAINADRIVAVGTEAEIREKYRGRRTLSRPDAMITPGLINTHTHAPMSLLRGIADDMRLQDWLENFIFPAEAKNVSPEFVRWGTRLACAEMLLSGTTTYTDMYYFEDVIAETTKECGMRGVLGQTIIGFPVPDAKTPAEALAFTEKYLQRFKNDPLIVPAVAPHAIYTNSDETLKASRELANKYGAPIIIHLSETKRENDETIQKRGKSPTQALEALGFFEGRTIAAHGVWLDDEDLAILKRRGVGVAHCPSSNMKLASGVAPVVKMLEMEIALGLGPDGPAGSNNDFQMFEEMDLAAKLQKVTTGDPTAVTAQQAMEMATIGGARVLGMEKEIGSLEAGKRADLITIKLDSPHTTPIYNVYSHLAYVIKGSDVTDVMINGAFVVRGRRIQTMNEPQVREKAEELARRIKASLAK